MKTCFTNVLGVLMSIIFSIKLDLIKCKLVCIMFFFFQNLKISYVFFKL